MRPSALRSLALPACILVLATFAHAQTVITRYVIGDAGGTAVGVHHTITATLGEPIVGPTSSVNHEVCAGFWKAAIANPPACPGDADGDGAVGLSDVAAIINCWAQPAPCDPDADLDMSGSIGLGDVAIVTGNWATTCP